MNREEAIKLLRACAVLYHGADDEIRRLAENEFSGCASTQRQNLEELATFLKNESRAISAKPNPVINHKNSLASVICKTQDK